MAKPKDDKEFHAFLKKNKVDVKDGRIKIADSHRIAELHDKYLRQNSKKSGLPKSLLPHKDKVVEFSVYSAPRNNQNAEKYHVTIEDDERIDDSWTGILKGTVQNLYKCLNAEDYGVNAGDIEEELLEVIKYTD